MGAVLVPDGYQSVAIRDWDLMKVDIGRKPNDVFHWVSVKPHAQRLHSASTLTALTEVHLIGVVFSKWDTPNTSTNGVRQPDYLYNWLLRLMLERLSWFGMSMGGSVRPVFAQVKGMDPRKLHSYVSVLNMGKTSVEWGFLHLPASIDTPKNRSMLQLSDAFCGMLNAAFEWDSYGNTEQRYLDIVRPRIWRRASKPLNGYGLKVSPYPHPRHFWVTDFCTRP